MCDRDVWEEHRHEIEGRLVHRTQDDWGEIWVVDNGSHRKLMFGSPFEQSCMDLAEPYRPVHEYARALLLALAIANPDKVLMLGLGGGVLAHAIRRAKPYTAIQIIELRERVLEVATDYFSLPRDDLVEIQLADARAHIRTCVAGSADLLIADLFHHSSMHPFQRQSKFFAQCHRVLSDDGWLAINFDHLDGSQASDLNSLCRLFPTVLRYSAEDGNQIVLAGKTPELPSPDQLEQQVHRLETALALPLVTLLSRVSRIDPTDI